MLNYQRVSGQFFATFLQLTNGWFMETNLQKHQETIVLLAKCGGIPATFPINQFLDKTGHGRQSWG
jgi:hypothetical protein